MPKAPYLNNKTAFILSNKPKNELRSFVWFVHYRVDSRTDPPQPVDLTTIHGEDPCYMSKPGAPTLIAGHCICNANGRSVMFKQVKVDWLLQRQHSSNCCHVFIQWSSVITEFVLAGAWRLSEHKHCLQTLSKLPAYRLIASSEPRANFPSYINIYLLIPMAKNNSDQ